jgi:hypothetical protein
MDANIASRTPGFRLGKEFRVIHRFLKRPAQELATILRWVRRMSRTCDRTYVVHHYLDQLPSQPPKLAAEGGVGLPSSNESHPMDHDGVSSGHARIKSLTPQPYSVFSGSSPKGSRFNAS